jgi:hypothetical protein
MKIMLSMLKLETNYGFHELFPSNISDISWRSVLLVEETRVPGENH